MISTTSTFDTAHQARQKQPLYYLEIDEVDVAWASFPVSALAPFGTGYGIQGYGLVGYGF